VQHSSSIQKEQRMFLCGQASGFCSRDACCLRDGDHAPSLAGLVPKDLSFTVYHHDDYGVGLRQAEGRPFTAATPWPILLGRIFGEIRIPIRNTPAERRRC
jgi:hypothetical protein